MYIKRYTIAVAIFILLVGWYLYAFVASQSISPSFFGIILPSLPIAAWVAILLFFVYFISILHFSYYSLIGNFRLLKYKKDYEKLLDALTAALLGKENRHFDYKTERYKVIGQVLEGSSIYLKENIEDISNDKIASIVALLQKIKNAEVVELKKYNLSNENPLVVQNDKNRYQAGKITTEEILKKSDNYSRELCVLAYGDLVKTSTLEMILKYKKFLDATILFSIMQRVNSEENGLHISNEELVELISTVELTDKEYIALSQNLSLQMVPEDRIKLFEILSEKDEKSMGAYLYTLFDLEMLTAADEVLDNTQPNEYEAFKAYRALKKCNQNYNISLFI